MLGRRHPRRQRDPLVVGLVRAVGEALVSILFGIAIMAVSAVATEANFGAMAFWSVGAAIVFDELVWWRA